MPPTHISGTSRALYRVFIAPTLRTPTSIPLIWAPAFAHPPSLATQSPNLTRTIIRTKSYQKDTARHALSDHYILDNAIKSERINFVDENGTFTANVDLDDALYRVNRTTHHLVQMTPGRVDEFGNVDPNDVPTCRVVSKMSLREQHSRKLELARRQAKGLAGSGPAPKNLEFNWAIAGGDLKHRLGKLREFLRDGRKVEIMLGPKNKGRKATEEEAESVMKAITGVMEECKGATQVKSEGTLGGVMLVTLQGWKEKEKEKGKEKKKKGRGGDEEEGRAVD